MKKLIEDMRSASSQAVGGTAFLDRHTLELAANQIEQMQSRLKSLENDAARYPLGYSGGGQSGVRVILNFETQETAESWFDAFMDKVDTAMQQIKD